MTSSFLKPFLIENTAALMQLDFVLQRRFCPPLSFKEPCFMERKQTKILVHPSQMVMKASERESECVVVYRREIRRSYS